MYFRRLKDLREDCDKTQKQIADYLGIHEGVYRRYEKGIRDVPVDILIRLADYYHVSLDYLVERVEKKYPIPSLLQLFQKHVPKYEKTLSKEEQ